MVRGAGVHPDQAAELGSGINLSLTDFGNTKERGNHHEFSSLERKQPTERLRGVCSRGVASSKPLKLKSQTLDVELQDWVFTLLGLGLALGLALLSYAHIGSFGLGLYVHCLDTW